MVTYQGQADVTESAVVGASDRPVEVELTREAQPLFGGNDGASTTVENETAVRAPAAPATRSTA